jgi:hypothetical protein
MANYLDGELSCFAKGRKRKTEKERDREKIIIEFDQKFYF